MPHFNKKVISLALVLTLSGQLLSGCSYIDKETIMNALPEDYIQHRVTKELKIDTDKLTPSFIKKHLTFDKGVYEYDLGDGVVAESYTIKTRVNENSKEEIAKQLPDTMQNYDIDWPAVIGKFAIGTGVIICVVAVTGLTDGTTYFIGISPETVATQAVVGAAVGGALQNVIQSVKQGTPLPKGAVKHAVEGAADGFMWCAVSGALLPLPDLQEKFELLKYIPADKLNMKLASGVYDKAGRRVGEAIYATGKDVMDSEPRKRIDEFVTKAFKYKPPINSELVLGTGEKVFTDSTGAIYRIGDKLLPDVKFTIDGTWFETDKLGRIVEIDLDKYSIETPSFEKWFGDTSFLSDLGDKTADAGKSAVNATKHVGQSAVDAGKSAGKSVADAGKSAASAMDDALKKTWQAGRNATGKIKLKYDDTSFNPKTLWYSFTSDGKDVEGEEAVEK